MGCPEPRAPSPEPIRWHLIGHLQSNKAKQAVELFDVIHSVDSQALVKELDRQASKLAQGSRVKGEGKNLKPLEVLIQVNVSGESTKFGCRLEELTPLAQVISTCRRLKLVGLMTMAPFAEDSELARPHFRRLRRRRDDLAVDWRHWRRDDGSGADPGPRGAGPLTACHLGG
ncbi:MAG: alanine racemase [Candidatus Omnitrophica bacterium]|nr:alanine racemase [Candidatus Omnitrophota bacterium]